MNTEPKSKPNDLSNWDDDELTPEEKAEAQHGFDYAAELDELERLDLMAPVTADEVRKRKAEKECGGQVISDSSISFLDAD